MAISTLKTACLKIASQLNKKYNFRNFILGDSNQSAHSAAFFVSCNQGEKLFNPLFIYGESGLGKTHLAHAICNEIKERFPNKNVLCICANDFCNQYDNSLENHKQDDFVVWLESNDILILEDIQFLSGNTNAQNVILNSYDTFCENGKQIVITADRQLNELQDINPQLLSRFKRGLMVALERPDYTTRLAVLKKLISHNNVSLSEEIIAYIAQNVKSNIRDLKLCFDLLITESQAHKKDTTLDFTSKMIRHLESLISKSSIKNLLNDNNTIKTIGLGSTGCSIVEHLDNQQIADIDCIACHSETVILENCSVKFQIKNHNPFDIDKLYNLMLYDAILNYTTKTVLFITEIDEITKYPILSEITQLAKERGIISVGIVVIPKRVNGNINQIELGNLNKLFDSFLVIDTNNTNKINPTRNFAIDFEQFNMHFTSVVKSLTSIITHPQFDIIDIDRVLRNNNSIFSVFCRAYGKNRAGTAIKRALKSPYLRENQIANTKNILLLISSGTTTITIDEIGVVNDYIQSKTGYNTNITMVVDEDLILGKSISIAIIGSASDSQKKISKHTEIDPLS